MSKVVVIEEDAAMRALISEWLNGEGHVVMGLPSVNALSQSVPGCDIVILDLVNLRAQGASVVSRARALFPGAALLGMSTQLGRTMDLCSALARDLGISGLLAKPCMRDELLKAFDQAIKTCD
ncbi:MAG: response regulator [Burkholderiaceae bacterium]